MVDEDVPCEDVLSQISAAKSALNKAGQVVLVAISLTISGILNPVVGALVHNAGSVAVIINSDLILKWKK